MATFAAQMVTKLEAVLLANAGVTSLMIDGRQVSYAEITKQYEFWKNKVAKETGARPWLAQIKTGQP